MEIPHPGPKDPEEPQTLVLGFCYLHRTEGKLRLRGATHCVATLEFRPG